MFDFFFKKMAAAEDTPYSDDDGYEEYDLYPDDDESKNKKKRKLGANMYGQNKRKVSKGYDLYLDSDLGEIEFIPEQHDGILKESLDARDIILNFIDKLVREKKIFTPRDPPLTEIFSGKDISHLDDIFQEIYKRIRKTPEDVEAILQTNILAELFLSEINDVKEYIREVKLDSLAKARAELTDSDSESDPSDDDDIVYPDTFRKKEEEENKAFIEDYNPEDEKKAEEQYEQRVIRGNPFVVQDIEKLNRSEEPKTETAKRKARIIRERAEREFNASRPEVQELAILKKNCPRYINFDHVLQTLRDENGELTPDQQEDFFHNVIWPYGVTSFVNFGTDKLLDLLYKYTKNEQIRKIMRKYALPQKRCIKMREQARVLQNEAEGVKRQPKKKRRREDDSKGSGILTTLLGKLYVDGVSHYFNDISKERKKYESKKKQLESKLKESGGSAFRAVDLLAGPVGWVRMGVRAKREKELNNLRKRVAKKTLERVLQNQESLIPPKDLTGAGKGFYFYY